VVNSVRYFRYIRGVSLPFPPPEIIPPQAFDRIHGALDPQYPSPRLNRTTVAVPRELVRPVRMGTVLHAGRRIRDRPSLSVTGLESWPSASRRSHSSHTGNTAFMLTFFYSPGSAPRNQSRSPMAPECTVSRARSEVLFTFWLPAAAPLIHEVALP